MTHSPSMIRLVLCCCTALWVVGCQSTREQMLSEGYPVPFIDGYESGCGSGRQAAGALDTFRKDVPRYLQQPAYAEGWDDGFRQCKAALENDIERDWHPSRRDEEWREHVDQTLSRALRRR